MFASISFQPDLLEKSWEELRPFFLPGWQLRNFVYACYLELEGNLHSRFWLGGLLFKK